MNPAQIRLLLILLFLHCLCGCNPNLPSKVESIGELSNPLLEVRGIYPDGWIGENASCILQQPAGAAFLSIRGSVPKAGAEEFQTELSISIDGREAVSHALTPGDFEISTPVPSGAGTRKVTLAFSHSQMLPGDGRLVAARLTAMGFEFHRTGPPEISLSARIRLGNGWGGVESFGGETFRWVENDAYIKVQTQEEPSVRLTVLVEAGPGVGDNGCVLKVLDRQGQLVAAQFIRGRVTAEFHLPTDPKAMNEFRLHVDTGGNRTASDPRVLNFRILKIE